MKLLGEPSLIRPDVLWNVVRYLNSVGGTARLDTMKNLFMGHAQTGVTGQEQDSDFQTVAKALEALLLLEISGKKASNVEFRLLPGAPKALPEFCDHLHHHLAVKPIDSDIIEAYAALAALVDSAAERHALQEYLDDTSTAKKMAAKIRSFVPEENVFNDTRVAAFRHWAAALGLGLGGTISDFYPVPSRRLARVLTCSTDFSTGESKSTAEIRALVSREMPYLDGSERYRVARHRIQEWHAGLKPPLSRAPLDHATSEFGYCLSSALRFLESSGELELNFTGDAHVGVRLTDGRVPERISTIRLKTCGVKN